MLTFKKWLSIREYNTTGEVDGENNTDLGKPEQPKTRWYTAKKKCGLGGLPCSKYSAQMKKEAIEPGMPTKNGHYEPNYEPDLGNFIANKFQHVYGEPTDEITEETGFLLSDGRCVPMGKYGSHADDHRSALPP